MLKRIYTLSLKVNFHILKIFKTYRDRIFLDVFHISSFGFPGLKSYERINITNSLFSKSIEFSDFPDFNSYSQEVCSYYIQHKFNFLGSGWKNVVKHPVLKKKDEILKSRCLKQNFKFSVKILNLIEKYNPNYEFIDWQNDFVNSYIWDERSLSKRLKYKVGADIKIPWELGRCQHLPQLALNCYINYCLNDRCRDGQNTLLLNEFKAQILDFIIFNPPRYGTQWFHSMDVAIRISNWLLAFDIFRISNANFDDEFLNIFNRSILQHGNHIFHNLERYVNKRGNHYFADLIGLLFISFYLPENRLTKKWQKFVLFSYIEEFDFQFFNDGGNIEGSTAYHRLVAEFVLWGTLLIEKFPEKILIEFRKKLSKNIKLAKYVSSNYYGDQNKIFLSSTYYERLKLIYNLLKDVSKPDGIAWVIGDNDNGRLFKFTVEKELFSSYLSCECMCDSPNFQATISAYDGFFGEEVLRPWLYYTVEKAIVLSIKPNIHLFSDKIEFIVKDQTYPDKLIKELYSDVDNTILYDVTISNIYGLEQKCYYPEFGIFVFKSENVFLGIRCGGLIKNKITGHRHIDQLCVEIYNNGIHIIRDPGMPTYTADPLLRNFYRSERAHFLPEILSVDKIDLTHSIDLGLINFAECLFINENTFFGKWQIGEKILYRLIEITMDKITIRDHFKASVIYNAMQISSSKIVKYSPGYGCISDQNSILIQANLDV